MDAYQGSLSGSGEFYRKHDQFFRINRLEIFDFVIQIFVTY